MDLGELPFDMPKLRRRLRVGGVNLNIPPHISNNLANNALNNNILSTDTSGVSQASSSQSMQQDDRPIIGKLSNCNYDVVSSLSILSDCFVNDENLFSAPWQNKNQLWVEERSSDLNKNNMHASLPSLLVGGS